MTKEKAIAHVIDNIVDLVRYEIYDDGVVFEDETVWSMNLNSDCWRQPSIDIDGGSVEITEDENEKLIEFFQTAKITN